MPGSVQIEAELPVFRTVDGHHRPVPFILTRDMFGGIPLELGGAEISNLVDTPVAEAHVHEVPEIYLLFAPNPGDAVITVEVDDQSYQLTAPGALYVPAGARHRFVTRKAVPGSFCFGLFVHGTGGTAASAHDPSAPGTLTGPSVHSRTEGVPSDE